MKLIRNEMITSEMQAEQQIKMLKQLIKSPPATSRIVEFSPELATFILNELNYKNRPRKTSKIVQYATDMAADKWLITGETIAFGSDGLLKDGQNRLAACVRAGTSFKTHVMFGIDPLAFAVMDTGANRSHSDVLSIMGVPNAKRVTSLLRLFFAWDNGKTDTGKVRLTNEELRVYYVEKVDEDLAQRSAKMSEIVWKVTEYPPTHIGALYYRASKAGHEEKVIEFFDALRSGVSKARSPQKILMKHITGIRANPSYKLTSHDYAVLLNRAFYCFINKQTMTKDHLIVLLTDKLPNL